MPSNSLSKLEKIIASAASERDVKEKKVLDDQSSRKRLWDDSITAWALRKNELPSLVETIDAMLKAHGYIGLSIGTFDLKHSDIDRVIIEFRHSPHNITKILLCVTTAGEFVCSSVGSHSPTTPTRMMVADLTDELLKETVSQAVAGCLNRKSGLKPD